MNLLLRISLSLWILAGGLFAFLGCAMIGFILAFTDMHFMYNVTPFMSFTALGISLFCIKRIFKTKPADYIAKNVRTLFKKPKKKRVKKK